MQQSNVVPITSARSVTPPTRKISAREAATDIKSGMSDFILMEKYTLSNKGLQSLFQKLVDASLVSKSELSNRTRWGKILLRSTSSSAHPVACLSSGHLMIVLNAGSSYPNTSRNAQ